MIVIGLGHKARQGKNLVAQLMVKELGSRNLYAKDYAFADALRAVCRVQFGMKEKDPELLQLVGTNLYRRQNLRVWIDALKWKMAEDKPDVAIVTDVRFYNECDMITEFGGFLFRVQRFHPNGQKYLSEDRDPFHPSECDLDHFNGWSSTIKNDGSIEDLTQDINWLLKGVVNVVGAERPNTQGV